MDQLGVFAKYWQPGKVKTRLAASIGDDAAAELSRLFLEKTIRNVELGFSGKRVLAHAPASRSKAFNQLVDANRWQIEPQSDGDLGQRMSTYFRNAFANGSTKVALIGSDSPDLPIDRIQQSFDALDSNDVVLGPSDDGGYYLVGMRRFVPGIFDSIAWSSDQVFDQTLNAAAANGIELAKLATWYDVDEIDDMRRLKRQLEAEDNQSELARKLAKLLGSK